MTASSLDGELSSIATTFVASIRSVGTACTLAAVGIYLHRRRSIVGDGKRTLALISQQVTIPLFLCTKIIYCNQDWSENPCPDVTQSLADVYYLLFWPAYVVGVGLLIGYVAAKLSGTPPRQVRAVLAACGFGNSTGLPITLLSVIHQNFPADSDLGRIDPCLFLSVYLLLYPVLQWGVGGWLLAPEENEDEAPTEIETKSMIDSDQQDEQEDDDDTSERDGLKESFRRIKDTIFGGQHEHHTQIHNVLNNKAMTKRYRRARRGMSETDASLYMSVQEALNDLGGDQKKRKKRKLQKENQGESSDQGEPLSQGLPIGMNLDSDDEPEEYSPNPLVPQTDVEAPPNERSSLLNTRHPSQLSTTSADTDSSDSSTQSGGEGPYLKIFKKIASRCLQPPVVGAMTGMFIASFPSIRGIFVDLIDRNDNAPMEWMFDGLYAVGQAAVPINMIILGCNLHASYELHQQQRLSDQPKSTKLLSKRTMAAIVIGKMLVMPIVGFLSALFFRTYLWDIPGDIAGSFYLVVMIVFLTPTANNVMVMVELSGSGSKEGMAQVIAWQYAAAPFLLSITMTAAVGIASRWS